MDHPIPILTRTQLNRVETAFACRRHDPDEWNRVMDELGATLLEELKRHRRTLLEVAGDPVRPGTSARSD